MTGASPDLATYRARCCQWLASRLERRRADAGANAQPWGIGSDDVSVFHDLSFDEERDLLDLAMKWQQVKFDAG